MRANGNEGSSTIGVGGQVPSRLDDINPEDIETINVIKDNKFVHQEDISAV